MSCFYRILYLKLCFLGFNWLLGRITNSIARQDFGEAQDVLGGIMQGLSSASGLWTIPVAAFNTGVLFWDEIQTLLGMSYLF